MLNHAKCYLGEISGGLTDDEEGRVIYFNDFPEEGVAVYMTVGLSNHVLDLNGKKRVRQELVTIAARNSEKQVASLLLYICDCLLCNHQAALRGDLIAIPENSSLERVYAVYFTFPSFVSDDFSVFYSEEDDFPTIFVWVIPIFENEADFVEKFGWDKFEDVLEDEGGLFAYPRIKSIFNN